MPNADHTAASSLDHDLDALVTGTPEHDHASEWTSDPATSADLRRAAHQFHGLAARADQGAADAATRQTLDSIWENVMNAHVPSATTIAPLTTRPPGRRPRSRPHFGRPALAPGVTRWHGIANGLLAAVLILAIAAGFWRATNSFGPGDGGDGRSASQLGALSSQVATPIGTPLTDIEQAGFVALTPDDCTTPPRSREEMVSILSTTPSPDGISLPSEGAEPSDYREVDQRTYDTLQDAYFQWQACTFWAMTWQVAATQSEERNRFDMYLTVRHPNGRTPYDTVTPYSAGTLNEILDGWEEADAADRVVWESVGFTQADEIWVIDPASLTIASDGSSASFLDTKLTRDRGSIPREHQVVFIFQDGSWRFDYRDRCCG